MTHTVIYEKGLTSWGAYVPDLPGGNSRDEVERLIYGRKMETHSQAASHRELFW
jgi:hypothetical protein